MKNLKMFAIALLSMLVMTTGVSAAGTVSCTVGNDCEATVDGEGYASASDAINAVLEDGGELVLYKNATITGANNVTAENAVINLGEYTLTINGGSFTVKDGAALTVKGKVDVTTNTIPFTVEKGGSLTLDGATVNAAGLTSNVLIHVAGGNVNLVSSNVTAASVALINVVNHNSVVTLTSGTYNVKSIIDVNIANEPVLGETAASVNIKGGTYNTAAAALYAKKGIALNIEGGEITANSLSAVKVYDADVTISGGTITAKGGAALQTYAGTSDTGAANGKLTITGGTLTSKHTSALVIERAKLTYDISGGTFNGKDAEGVTAIKFGNSFALTETKDDKVVISSILKGILSGGRYLNQIADIKVVDEKGKTIILTDDLVKEGLTVTEEGNYKVINAQKVDDQQNTGDGEQTTAPENTNTNVPNVPKTNDNILVYAGLGLVSALTVGFSAKRKENN